MEMSHRNGWVTALMQMLVGVALVWACFTMMGCSSTSTFSSAATIDQSFEQGLAACELGDYERAVRYFLTAWEDAVATGSLSIAGDLAYLAASSAVEGEQFALAQEMIKEARAAFTKQGGNAGVTYYLEAQNFMAQGHLPDAYTSVSYAVTLLDEEPDPRVSALEAQLLRVDVGLLQEKSIRARSDLALVEEYIDSTTPGELLARAAKAFGQVYVLESNPFLAARQFDLEANFLRDTPFQYESATAWVRAGEQYIESGQVAVAVERFIGAGEMLFDLGDALGAYTLAERALDLQKEQALPRSIERAEQFRARVSSTINSANLD